MSTRAGWHQSWPAATAQTRAALMSTATRTCPVGESLLHRAVRHAQVPPQWAHTLARAAPRARRHRRRAASRVSRTCRCHRRRPRRTAKAHDAWLIAPKGKIYSYGHSTRSQRRFRCYVPVTHVSWACVMLKQHLNFFYLIVINHNMSFSFRRISVIVSILETGRRRAAARARPRPETGRRHLPQSRR